MARIAAFAIVLGLACGPAHAQPPPAPATAESSAANDNAVASPSESAARDSRTFGGFLRALGRDFRNLPSLESGIVLGVGGGLAAAVHGDDAAITHRWATSAVLDGVFEPGAVMGGGWVQVGGALGTYVAGRVAGSPRTTLLGADLVRAQIVNTVLTQGIKVAVNRQRPDGTPYSFPSGHTSSTFTTAAVLQRYFGWKAAVPAYAVAAFVGGSRLQENRHYLSDVVFGAAIGIVSGRTASIGHGAATFQASPLIAPGTVGVLFTRNPRR